MTSIAYGHKKKTKKVKWPENKPSGPTSFFRPPEESQRENPEEFSLGQRNESGEQNKLSLEDINNVLAYNLSPNMGEKYLNIFMPTIFGIFDVYIIYGGRM